MQCLFACKVCGRRIIQEVESVSRIHIGCCNGAQNVIILRYGRKSICEGPELVPNPKDA